MGLKIYLIFDCTCVFLAFLNFIGNSRIVYLFVTKRLDSRRNLRIILFMAISDIAFSVMIMPQILYMITYWDQDQINYEPRVIASTSWPLPVVLKISIGLNFGAALERILALCFPMIYRKIDHVQCSNILMLCSILLGLLDALLAILSFRFESRINCSSIGCFVTSLFRTYWGSSNMVCGVIIICMSVFVFVKVQKLGKHNGRLGHSLERKQNIVALYSIKATTQKFRQANRTSCGVLFSCLFCLTIPSMLVSIIETLFAWSIFEKVGPFYVASLLLNGLVNCIIFLILNGRKRSNGEIRTLSDTAVTTIASSRPYSMK